MNYKEIIIGKSVIKHYFTYYEEVGLDDETEFLPALKIIIAGIIAVCKKDKDDIKNELENYARSLYCDLWLLHAKEDEDDIDVTSEKKEALNTFNEIYKNL